MFDLDTFDREFQSPEWLITAKDICHSHGLTSERRERAGGSDHIVVFIDDEIVLKIYRPDRNCFERERKALESNAERKSKFLFPEIIHAGHFKGFDYLIFTRLPGEAMSRGQFLELPPRVRTRLVETLASELSQFHSFDSREFVCDWKEFVDDRAETFIARQIKHGVNSKIINALPAFFDENLGSVPLSPTVFLHGDVHFGNLRFGQIDSEWRLLGLFDFADSRRGFFEYDLIAVGVLMLQGERELQREFLLSYGYREKDLDEAMRRRLMLMTILYETSDLKRYALRLRPDAVELNLEELEKAIWSFV